MFTPAFIFHEDNYTFICDSGDPVVNQSFHHYMPSKFNAITLTTVKSMLVCNE